VKKKGRAKRSWPYQTRAFHPHFLEFSPAKNKPRKEEVIRSASRTVKEGKNLKPWQIRRFQKKGSSTKNRREGVRLSPRLEITLLSSTSGKETAGPWEKKRRASTPPGEGRDAAEI